jgi:hypothetical protein
MERGGFGHRDPLELTTPGRRATKEAVVKPLASAAVFGLVPVPPAISTTESCGPTERFADNDNAPVEDLDFAQLAPPHPEDAAERMATKDELARIRRQLEDQTSD